ncbi:hypothetical protein AAEX28_13045 [Lentisphaerota bacterium WC36G]|nr:hypothetical protein LJT99_15870 [Lentisphaerae bacterium WC36]
MINIQAQQALQKVIHKNFSIFFQGFIVDRAVMLLYKFLSFGFLLVLTYLLSIYIITLIALPFIVVGNLVICSLYGSLAFLQYRKRQPFGIYNSLTIKNAMEEVEVAIDSIELTEDTAFSQYHPNFGFNEEDKSTDIVLLIFKILKAPGDALGDICVVFRQIYLAFKMRSKHLKILKFVGCHNPEAVCGSEILNYINKDKYLINELKCRDILHCMIEYEWLKESENGFKLTAKMRKKLLKELLCD